MTPRAALCVVFGLLCGLAAVDARATSATDDCDQMSLVEASGEPTVVEAVVPCAMADSGALGADCHDAAFYVVNHLGTLLCRVDVAAWNTGAQSAAVDVAPPALPAPTPSVMSPAIPTLLVMRVPRQRIDELPPAIGPPALGAGIDITAFQPRPS